MLTTAKPLYGEVAYENIESYSQSAKQRVNVEGTIYECRNYDHVLDDVKGRSQSGALVAMGTSGKIDIHQLRTRTPSSKKPRKNLDRIIIATQSYSRDGIEKLLDGKVGYDELLTLGDFLLFSFTEELVLLDLSCRGSDRTLSESTGHFVGV